MINSEFIVDDHLLKEAISQGTRKLSLIVGQTYGPYGKNIVIEKIIGSPLVTKDGSNVANEVFLKDRYERLFADIVKNAAKNVAKEVGDGTTTTILLTSLLYNAIIKDTKNKDNLMEKEKILNELYDNFCLQLDDNKRIINNKTDIFNVANISSNGNSEISTILSKIFDVNVEPLVHFEMGDNWNTEFELIKGYQINRTILSTRFITDGQKQICELTNPFILLVDNKIENTHQIKALLEVVSNLNRSLLIIANEFERDVIASLVANKTQGIVTAVPIISPEIGKYRENILNDIASITNAKVISHKGGVALTDIAKYIEEQGKIPIGIIGECEKIIINDVTTKIFGINNKLIEALTEQRVNSLKLMLEDNNVMDEDKNMIKERIAKLTSGIAKIKIGGRTEQERKEKYDKFEDAYYAVKAALKDGIVEGACTQYLKYYIRNTSHYSEAFFELFQVLYSSIYQQVEVQVSELIREYKKNINCNLYIDFSDFNIKKIENIYDPVTVIKQATKTAINTALLLAKTGASIIEIEDI